MRPLSVLQLAARAAVAEDGASELVGRLGRGTWKERRADERRLAALGPGVVPPLVPDVHGTRTSNVRRAALNVVAAPGPGATRNHYAASVVRLAAALLLLALPARAGDDVESLLARLGRGTSAERRSTVEALAARGMAVLPRIESLLASEEPAFVRAAAVDVLGAVRPIERELVKRSIALLDDEQVEVRTAAAQALAGFGPAGRAAAPELERRVVNSELPSYLRRRRSRFRRNAGPPLCPEAGALISVACDDPGYVESLLTTRGLGKVFVHVLGTSGTQELVAHYFASPSALVREAVVNGYEPPEHLGAFWIRQLRKRVEHDPEPAVRDAAMRQLAIEASPALRGFAEARMGSERPGMRVAAAALLCRLPPAPESTALFRRALEDRDEEVFALAALGLRLAAVDDPALRGIAARARACSDRFARTQGALLYLRCGGTDEWAVALAAAAMFPRASGKWYARRPRISRDAALRTTARLDILFPVAGTAIPHVYRAGKKRPKNCFRVLKRFGPDAAPWIDRLCADAKPGLCVEIVLTLAEFGDRRPAVARDLVYHLQRSRVDAGPFARAVKSLGRGCVPALVEEYRRHVWEPDGPFEEFVGGLAALGPAVLDDLDDERLKRAVRARLERAP